MKIFSRKKDSKQNQNEHKSLFHKKGKEINPSETSLSFTKKIVGLVLVNGILWVWCSYILAFLGMNDIAESLSSQVVTVVLGTGLGYFVKSLVENLSKYSKIKIFNNGESPINVVEDIQQEVQEGMNIQFNEEDNGLDLDNENNGENNDNIEDTFGDTSNFIEFDINNLNDKHYINNYDRDYVNSKYDEYFNSYFNED